MNPGAKALLSGFVAFVVATATTLLVRGERTPSIQTLTIGGLTGGAVALSVWLSASTERVQPAG